MSKSLRCFLPILTIALSSPQVAYAAKEPIKLQPSSKWVMRHQDDSCRLVRLFGEGDDKMMIVMTRFGPGARFRMTLAGNPVKIHSDKRPLKIQFGMQEIEQEIPYAIGEAGGLPALVAIKPIRIDGIYQKAKRKHLLKIEDYAAVDFIKIRVGQKRRVILETGSLAPPVRAMGACVRKMMVSWGVDPHQHRKRTRSVKAVGNVSNWLRSKDYPKAMLKERQPALINYRLSIDKEGKATDCHIQQTTRPKEFDDAVCDGLMERSSFTPALDADGNPMASYWRSQVRFTIGSSR